MAWITEILPDREMFECELSDNPKSKSGVEMSIHVVENKTQENLRGGSGSGDCVTSNSVSKTSGETGGIPERDPGAGEPHFHSGDSHRLTRRISRTEPK